jgi:hypothetical protein
MTDKELRSKERGRELSFPVLCNYHVEIIVTPDVCGSARARATEMRGFVKYSDSDALAIGNGAGRSWMLFQYSATPGDIAHEAYHVVSQIYRYIGQELDDEMAAYHLGYIVDAANELLAKPNAWKRVGK